MSENKACNLADAWIAMEQQTPCEVLTETGWKRTLVTAIVAKNEDAEIHVLDPRQVYWNADINDWRLYPGVRPPLPMQGYGAISMTLASSHLVTHLHIMTDEPLQG
jgi:hypothetical protein